MIVNTAQGLIQDGIANTVERYDIGWAMMESVMWRSWLLSVRRIAAHCCTDSGIGKNNQFEKGTQSTEHNVETSVREDAHRGPWVLKLQASEKKAREIARNPASSRVDCGENSHDARTLSNDSAVCYRHVCVCVCVCLCASILCR